MQRSSESIASLAAALAKAQAELVNPEKSLVATIRSDGSDRTEQTFRYAPLSSGLDIVRKTLGQHEIATLQTTAVDQAAGMVNLTTMLAHSSGEWIVSDWPVCPVAETANPQRMGAALTYARRYALFTLVGIAGEDDLDAPDLITPTSQISGPETPTRDSNGRLNGGKNPAQRAPLRRDGMMRAVSGRQILAPKASAELCNRLVAELNGLGCGDDAALWAHRNLSAKDGLTAADAQRVEEAFQAILETFASSAVADVAAQTLGGSEQPLPPHGSDPVKPAKRWRSKVIDKSVLALPEPRRVRDKNHMKFVAQQPCLICGRRPSDAHHLRFAQHGALGRKVSDEFTVPLCRGHHREAHRSGDEASWWSKTGIDPIGAARKLWTETHPVLAPANDTNADVAKPTNATRKPLDNATQVPRIPKQEPL
jgi:hypothetical protein